MLENKDPAITLFGRKISVATAENDDDEQLMEWSKRDDEEEAKKKRKESAPEEVTETVEQSDDPPANNGEASHSEGLPQTDLKPRSTSGEEESPKSKDSKTEEKQNEATNSPEKPLKKPDKILPCPRCNSMDTKFCYYNNYNVNQPRHFCKACQRYWTAGGTMRNVPVGAGRRKSKNSASHYRHITITEALQAARIEVPNGATHPALKTNGRVLSFGSLDAPICESMASILNLTDKKVMNGTLNGFHKFEVKGVQIPGKGGDNGDECSSNSSITVSNSMDEAGKNPNEPLMHSMNGFHAPMPCLPSVPWPYPWNSAVPPPAFCPSGYPMPFYPAAYWNCGVPSPLNVPWLSPQSQSNQKSPGSGPGSPLGKHSRDGEVLRPDRSQEQEQLKQKSPNGCVVIPKTLRIDDPSEAAKSSIWATLGIKNESISGGGMFNGFQSKSGNKKNIAKPPPALQANPAALSRSLNFQESV